MSRAPAYGRDVAIRYVASWVLGAISLVTLTAGLAIDRGATWVLVAVITGFGALVALGSGLVRKAQARRTPPS